MFHSGRATGACSECGGRAAGEYLDREPQPVNVPMSYPDPRWCARLRSPTPPPLDVDRTDFDPARDPRPRIECEICGNAMLYRPACRIMCGVCGYNFGCSDP